MTEADPHAQYLRLLALRDEARAAIGDERVDEIQDETRRDLIRVMRRGVSKLEKLGSEGNPSRAARVQGEVDWMRALIAFMGGLDS
jgi:hypothetical protein